MRRRRPAVPVRPDLGLPAPDGAQSIPPWPDRFRPPPRRRRFVALALVLSLLAPAALAVAAAGPWGDGEPAYSFIERRPDGSPFRWDPCRPIHYEVNLENAPPWAMSDVTSAIDHLTRGSGLRFVLDGQTDRTPSEQRNGRFHELSSFTFRPVLIAWLPSEEFELYADPDEVIAVGLAVAGSGEEYWVYKSGLVVINADAPIPPGFASGFSLGPVLMHELGHVLGLGHVGEIDEIMWSPDMPGSNPIAVSNATDWGDGDLEGLQRLGRPAGCIGAAA